MTAKATSLLESLLALPERDRLSIVEALLESLPEDSVEVDDDAFYEELKRRAEESRADPNAGISWSELKKMK